MFKLLYLLVLIADLCALLMFLRLLVDCSELIRKFWRNKPSTTTTLEKL